MSEKRGVLHLRLLGGCEIATAAGVVHLESAKTASLLAFLAVTKGTHSRAKLAGLLWPELPETRAATALRRALWDLKRRLSPPGEPPAVLATREAVAFNPARPHDLDVEDFLAALAGPDANPAAGASHGTGEDEVGRLERAAERYRGDLLDGTFNDDTPAFEEWLLVERERLRARAQAALRRLVGLLRQRGEPVRALAHARHLLALDSWLEEGHRAVAELLALTGQRAAALAQLETCRHLLAVELGVAPAPETVALERRLRADAGSAATPGAPPAPTTGLARHNLPLPATPFVGRHEELDVIARHLRDPGCRLLTLLGPGGIGKTRLALQAAYRLLGDGEGEGAFAPDVIVFVPPGETTGPELLAETLATALNLPPGVGGEARDRVRDALRGRRALLLLDSCEHRLGDLALVSELLAAAPEVKALATSRERLQLAGESVLEVGGLTVPRRDQRPDATRFPALDLFLKTASRARIGFTASGENLDAITEVCRALDGMPLAIEMAAAWMHTLSPRELRDELAGGLEVLTSPLRSAPAGQASLRAVFDHSFGRLAPDEQRVVRALSVFSGGMTPDAALAVGHASRRVLRCLADRSFLRLEPSSGRWALHEVLRHFASARLADAPDQRDEVGTRHAAFFLGFVREREDALAVRADHDAMEAVTAELDNIHDAWAWAVAGGQVERLAETLPALAAYCAASGRFRDGDRLISQAVEVLRTTSRATGLTRALLARGGLRNSLGRYDAAAGDLNEALSHLSETDAAGRALALLHLGDGALLQGRFAEAHALLAESIELARACGASRTLAAALGRRGRAVLDEGRHGEARALFSESLEVARAAGNRPAELYAANQLGFVAYFDGALDEAGQRFSATLTLAREAGDLLAVCAALDGCGFVAEDTGRLDEAAGCYDESLRIRQEIGDRFGAGRVLMLLGELARRQRQFEVARRRYHESLAINREIGSRFICGLLSGNLAYVAAAEGRGDEARDHIRATLLAYRDTGSATVGLPAVVSLAEVVHTEGDTSRALALLGLVLAHPGMRQDHGNEVERVLSRIRHDRPNLDETTALAAGQALTLEGVAAEVLADLPEPSGPPPSADP